MEDEKLEERSVEVLQIPDVVEDELLKLYFENKRRSGGGEVSSVDRNGDRAVIVFKSAQVAANVLSKESHTLSKTKLVVRKKPPKDKRKFILRGLSPKTNPDTLALYVENLIGIDPENYSLHPSPKKDLVLIHLHQAPDEDFQKLREKVSRKTLEKAKLSLEQVEHTNSILVQDIPSTVTEDLLVLYFESPRSGGGDVEEATWITPGEAKVTFKDAKSVDDVLQKPHKLEDTALIVKPYYTFLLSDPSPSPVNLQNGTEQVPDHKNQAPSEGSPDPISGDSADIEEAVTPKSHHPSSPEVSVPPKAPLKAPPDPKPSTCHISVPDPAKLELLSVSGLLEDLKKLHPGCSLTPVVDGVEIKATEAEQIKSKLLEFLIGVSQSHLPVSPLKAEFLQRPAVRDTLTQELKAQGTACTYRVSGGVLIVTAASLQGAEQACRNITLQVSESPLNVDPKYECMIYSEECRTFLMTQDSYCARVSEDGRSVTVVTLKQQEEQIKAGIVRFLSTPTQKETILSMEPAMLTYLQLHHQQLLVDMGEVVIYPLDTGDGLGIQGSAVECQNVKELLSAVMTSTETRTITVTQPGIARFLLQDEGTSILGEMTAKFQVYISLEKVHWEPLEEQDIFDLAWKMMSSQNFRRTSSSQASADLKVPAGKDTAAYIEEAKRILSSVPSGPASLRDTTTEHEEEEEEEEEDLYSEAPADQTMSEPLCLDEDAQLSLAIQLSMEMNQNELAEDDLQKVLQLSKAEARANNESSLLEKAVDVSLKEVIASANVAQIKVFASYHHDLVRVDIALGKKVGQRQHEEKVEHRCLRKLSALHKRCVDLIKRKHAVEIQIEGTTAVVSGFKDYVAEALPDLNALLNKAADTTSDEQIHRTVQWVWQKHGHPATPYSPEATVFIENAWKMKLKKIDVLLDNLPCTIDLEKMQEYSVSSGRSASISRRTISGLDRYSDSLDDYSLLSDLPDVQRVEKDTEEYDAVIEEFMDSMKDKDVNIIKVEKLRNHLLHSQYHLKKTDMEHKCQSQVERTLYHGTSERSVKEICIHGFNRSFCGKNATVYGQGVYFAVQSSYSFSDTYSPPNADGHKFIFVAKVLTGDYTTGRSDMKAAPLKESSESDVPMRYHSVVDRMDNPSLFVIFHDTQAFPQYLITCQKL